MTSGGTLYTLRCYFDDKPIFLGRNGISVFPSERTLARYLADEHDHDPSDLSTYDDICTAATDGSLRVDVTETTSTCSAVWPTTSPTDRGHRPHQLALAVEFGPSATTRGRHHRPAARRGYRPGRLVNHTPTRVGRPAAGPYLAGGRGGKSWRDSSSRG